ncbi:eukaryotic translation initiation factor 3 subunit G-like [Saccoglossus kowalevskii]|uniref:Eukaryotic translation initiation factor 3 subunit G n=1 Tax=Saccoglossus kowalevskii TaxID=10224 RepID=A0ABM0MEH9_SACKO|nr:PREDICTED: eukaryotic translation initiation factor 3 subunit G-like [Saccoglossus kowalevskii]
MPSADTDTKPSWADQVEEEVPGEDDTLPPSTEEINGDTKIVTDYKLNEDGKKVKCVRTFKIEKLKASRTVAARKNWPKFGQSQNDKPGPNPATTAIAEDVFMAFSTTKEETLNQTEEDPLKKLGQQRIVQCRVCKGDHWTTKCPYKDTLEPLQKEEEDKTKAAKPEPPKPDGKTGKYVPPSMRDGAGRGRGESMQPRRDEGATIRVTNLSEDTRESDLQELFRPFGTISRIYLAKDKVTGQSKGFAFINFHRREDAARAIQGVSGFGYDHLILNVEWAKPSGT